MPIFVSRFRSLVRRGGFLFILTVSLLAWAAVPAAARDEAAFAWGLAHRGYYDMAEDECKRIESDPRIGSEEKKQVPLVRALIKRKKVDLERDPAEKQRLIDEAIESLREYIKGNPSGDLTLQAKFDLAGYLQQKGETVLAQIEKETSTDKIKELRRQADGYFGEAESFCASLVREFGAGGKDPISLQRSMYMYPVVLFLHGLAFEPGDSRRKGKFEDALRNFDDYLWEYEGTLMSYDIGVFRGRTYAGLGRWDEAKDAFAGVLRLQGMDLSEEDESTINLLRGFVLKAYYYEAMVFNEKADEKDDEEARKFVISVVDDMAGKMRDTGENILALPDLWGNELAQRAFLEQAKAYFALGDRAKALDLAGRAAGYRSFTGQVLATRLLEQWGGGGGKSYPDDPDLLRKMIDGAFSQGNFEGAIGLCLALGSMALKSSKPDDFFSTAFYKMGRAYSNLDRHYEAALAYEQVETRFRKSSNKELGDLAAECSYRTAQCYARMNGIEANEFDKGRFLSALDDLRKNYPKSVYIDSISLILAENKEAEKEFLDAAKIYQSVDKNSRDYETALSRIGYCYFRHAGRLWSQGKKEEARPYFKQAEDALRDYIQRTVQKSKTELNQEKVAQWKELRFACRYSMAVIYLHEAIDQPEKVLDVLKDVDTEYGDDLDKVSKTYYMRQRAYLRVGKVEDAEKAFLSLAKATPDAVRILGACKDLAIAFGEAAQASQDPDRKAALDRRGADYLYRWLRESTRLRRPLSAENANKVGDQMVMLGRAEKDQDARREYFTRADAIFGEILKDKYPGEISIDKWKIKYKQIEARRELGQFKEALAILLEMREELKDTDMEGNILVQLMDLYIELGDKERNPDDRRRYFEEACRISAQLMRGTKEGEDEIWWRATYDFIYGAYQLGDFDRAGALLETLPLKHPDLGDEFGMKEKFLKLNEEIQARRPR